MECKQTFMESKHYFPSKTISLNKDLGKYGIECLGFTKSAYGLVVAKTSDTSLETAILLGFTRS